MKKTFSFSKCILFCRIAVIFAFNLCAGDLKAQTTDPPVAEMYKVTQAPPDAAALGKYGEYPVGYYTGTPSINIPFYELNAGRIKVPIGLSYHAGGIKVEEIASSVGLGWSLNAGGVITRTVMGLPDEVAYEDAGSFINPTTSIHDLITSGTDLFTRQKKMIAGKQDGEPDIFYFNFGTTSGKFMYHQEDEKFYSIPYSKMKIEFYDQASQSSFTLTDENGIQYHFEEKEYSVREREYVPLFISVTTSWYLTTIYDPVSKQTVYFQYIDYVTSYPTLGTESHYMPITNNGKSDYSSPGAKQDPTLHLKKVSMINTSSATVTFDYSLSRCDLPGDYALTGVVVQNNNQTPIKTYGLNYDYFLADSHSNLNCNDTEEAVFKRLKLTQVVQDPDGAALKHIFEYDNTTLPSRLSRAQDHWGYYNGANTNLHLYPPYNLVLPGLTSYLEGGNRDVQPTYAKAGILEKITYPTGGHTQFEFESNTAVSSQTSLPAPTSGGQIAFHGGGEENYLERPFTIFSEPCSQNGYQNGAYITLDLLGLDEQLIVLYGFPGISAQIKVIDMSTMEEFIYYQKSDEKNVGNQSQMPKTYYLPNGDYKFIVDFSQNPFPETYMEAHVNLTWSSCMPQTQMGPVNSYVGGLRLKKVTSLAATGATPLVKSYKYVQESNANLTSGQTHFNPQYFSLILFGDILAISDPYENRLSNFLKRTSSSNYPLVSEHGKSVGYSNVIEYNGTDDSNGYSQYKYTNYSEYDDEGGIGSYSHLPVSKQWLRGLELEKKVFRKNGSTLQLVSQTINEYDTQLLGVNKKTFEGFRGEFISSDAGTRMELVGVDMVLYPGAAPGIDVHRTYSDFVYLKRTKERVYDGTNYTEAIKDFTYNTKNLMPSIVQVTGSNGIKTILNTKYPLDFTLTSPSSSKTMGIKLLQTLNIIKNPIEIFKEKQEGSLARKLIEASYYSYLPAEPLVDTIFTMNMPSVEIQDYSGISASNSVVAKSINYEATVVVEEYDSYNNSILQQKKAKGSPVSYIYDYDKLYPVAEVKGAAVSEIAYTSFEADGKGNWNFAGAPVTASSVTGLKCYNLTPSAPVTRAGLDEGKVYILSYWAKGTGGADISGATATVVGTYDGWTMYSREISGSTSLTLSGTVQLDELRLYPKYSQISTYTYEMELGMTSQTDAKGLTTYYEYDGQGRLSNIKDQYGNIIKDYTYHYKP